MTDTLVLSVGRVVVRTTGGGTSPLSWGDQIPADIEADDLKRLKERKVVVSPERFAEILDGIGAVPTDGAASVLDSSDAAFVLADATPVELAAWIRDEKPTESLMLEMIGDDADLAVRVMDAEKVATEGDPRKLTQVAKIAARATQD